MSEPGDPPAPPVPPRAPLEPSGEPAGQPARSTPTSSPVTRTTPNGSQVIGAGEVRTTPTGMPIRRTPPGTRPTVVETSIAAVAAAKATAKPTTAPAQPWPVRLFAMLALAAAVGTYVAVQVDLLRRHYPGIEPEKYWLPQVEQVTLPGLAASLVLGLVAFTLHRLYRRPPKTSAPTSAPTAAP